MQHSGEESIKQGIHNHTSTTTAMMMTTTTTTKEAAPLASVEAEMERTMNEMDALSAQASQITERYAQLQVALTALTVRRAQLRNISPRMA